MSERKSIAFYLGKRLLQIVPQMLFTITFVFIFIRIPGGDPIMLMIGPGGASEEYVKMMRHRYNLDGSLLEQYVAYMRQVLQGDLGYSFYFNAPVVDIVLERLPNTIVLATTSSILAISLGILLGVLAARKQHSLIDYLCTSVSLMGFATPSMVLGIILMLVFGLWLPWFPVGGIASVTAEATGINALLDRLWHIVLPTITMGATFLASMSGITRDSMLEALGSDFILFARSRGLRERTIVVKHALRNALLPVTTTGGYAIARMLGGAVLTEAVFAWPGIGRLVYDSLLRLDYPVLLALFIYFGMIAISVNLIVDILYVLVDPRIRYK